MTATQYTAALLIAFGVSLIAVAVLERAIERRAISVARAWVVAAAIALFCFLVGLAVPALGATRWPTPAELQRCDPWPKDAKLRRWCTYWSKRLP